MLILGIETSGSGGSIALAENGTCRAERSLSREGRRHARTLVSEIGRLLTEHQRTPAELGAVAVSIGPGSFTGLRVGVVCAKTLAYAVSAKLVAVDSFLAIAEQSPQDVRQVQVVGDGQRGDLYVGRYERTQDGGWQQSAPIEIRPATVWLETLSSEDVVCGPGLIRHADEAARRCRVLPEHCHEPRGGTVAVLGIELAARGQFADLWSLEPFYLRRSGAEEKADAKAAGG